MEYLGLVDTDDEEEYEGEQPGRERSRHYETVGSPRYETSGASRYETPRPEPASRREGAARSSRYAPSYSGGPPPGNGSGSVETLRPVSAPIPRPKSEGRQVQAMSVQEFAVADDAPAYRIVTLQPRSYNEARQLGEEFREGTPVIMNLTDMDDVDAKRLVDFAAGLIFGLRGTIEKVTNKVFLLSPRNVEVSPEDKRRIAEGGFYNQS
jgi:FtsZ-interacting cell division protein YlmF